MTTSLRVVGNLIAFLPKLPQKNKIKSHFEMSVTCTLIIPTEIETIKNAINSRASININKKNYDATYITTYKTLSRTNCSAAMSSWLRFFVDVS